MIGFYSSANKSSMVRYYYKLTVVIFLGMQMNGREVELLVKKLFLDCLVVRNDWKGNTRRDTVIKHFGIKQLRNDFLSSFCVML